MANPKHLGNALLRLSNEAVNRLPKAQRPGSSGAVRDVLLALTLLKGLSDRHERAAGEALEVDIAPGGMAARVADWRAADPDSFADFERAVGDLTGCPMRQELLWDALLEVARQPEAAGCAAALEAAGEDLYAVAGAVPRHPAGPLRNAGAACLADALPAPAERDRFVSALMEDVTEAMARHPVNAAGFSEAFGHVAAQSEAEAGGGGVPRHAAQLLAGVVRMAAPNSALDFESASAAPLVDLLRPQEGDGLTTPGDGIPSVAEQSSGVLRNLARMRLAAAGARNVSVRPAQGAMARAGTFDAVISAPAAFDPRVLEAGRRRLAPDGTMAVLLPAGVGMRGEWCREIVDDGTLEAVVSLPGDGSQNNERRHALVLRWDGRPRDVLFIDAAEEWRNALAEGHGDEAAKRVLDTLSDCPHEVDGYAKRPAWAQLDASGCDLDPARHVRAARRRPSAPTPEGLAAALTAAFEEGRSDIDRPLRFGDWRSMLDLAALKALSQRWEDAMAESVAPVDRKDGRLASRVRRAVGYAMRPEDLWEAFSRHFLDAGGEGLSDAVFDALRHIESSSAGSLPEGILSAPGSRRDGDAVMLRDLRALSRIAPEGGSSGRAMASAFARLCDEALQCAARSGSRSGQHLPLEVGSLLAGAAAASLDRSGFSGTVLAYPDRGGACLHAAYRWLGMSADSDVVLAAQAESRDGLRLTALGLLAGGAKPSQLALLPGHPLTEPAPDAVLPSGGADLVLAAPPFTARLVEDVDFRDPRFVGAITGTERSTSCAAYVLHGLHHLKPGGRMAIVLHPSFCFAEGERGRLRRRLAEEGLLDAVIALPDKLFTETGSYADILVLRGDPGPGDVLFVDARSGYESEGASKRRRRLSDDAIGRIVETCARRPRHEPGWARRVSLGEIAAKSFNLNSVRYLGDGGIPPKSLRARPAAKSPGFGP